MITTGNIYKDQTMYRDGRLYPDKVSLPSHSLQPFSYATQRNSFFTQSSDYYNTDRKKMHDKKKIKTDIFSTAKHKNIVFFM